MIHKGILVLLILGFSSSFLWSQDDQYSFVSIENQNLESALEDFSKAYNLQLSYPSSILEDIYLGSRTISSESLNKILTDILSPEKIEYQLLDGQKLLLRKTNLSKSEWVNSDEMIDLSGLIKTQDGNALEFATVAVPTLNVGTYTDESGKYRLLIGVDAIDEDVLISYIGYESSGLKIRDLIHDAEITLSPSSVKIDDVTISAFEPLVIINELDANTALKISSILSINNSTIQGNDILRKLQFLPGINTADDKSSALRIRGGDDSETLVLVDGIPIYKTDHFYGIFGNINGDYIDDVTLYKNELPINQSGKSGGLVSMSSPQAARELNGSANIDLLNSSVNIGIPISKSWNVFIAGRASYNNVANAGFFEKDSNISEIESTNFNRVTVLGVTPSFDFYDLNAKLSYSFEKLKVNANFFKSYDVLESSFQNSFTTRGPRNSNRRITVRESFTNDESWGNDGASINVLANLPKEWTLASSSYVTQYEDKEELNFSIEDDRTINPTDRTINNENSNKLSDISSTLMASKIIGATQYSIGLKYVNYNNNLRLGEDQKVIFSNNQSGSEKGVFTSINHQLTKDLAVNAGLRAFHYSQSNQFYYSPQIALSYKSLKNVNLKSSISRNYQYMRELTYSNRFGEEVEFFVLSNTDKITVGSSDNFMIGGTFKRENWTVDIEAYHINRDNVMNFTSFSPQLLNGNAQNGNDNRFQLLNGSGQTRGIDFLVTYQKNNYSTMLSYTLSKSENSFKELFRNKPFPSQDDRRHQFSIVHSYRLDNWNFSANAVYSSGRNYTNFSILTPGQDRIDNNPQNFLQTLPYYLRFDFSTDYEFTLGTMKAILGASILNALNRENVKYIQFTSKIPVEQDANNGTKDVVIGTQTNQLSRIFNLKVGIRF